MGPRNWFAGFVCMCLASSSAWGQAIIQPASASSSMGQYSAHYLPEYAIDQSALEVGYTSGVTDFDSYVSSTSTVLGGSSFNTWFSQQSVLTGNFDFNLGGTFTIDAFAMWNDPQVTALQGIQDFELYAASEPTFAAPTLLGSYSAVQTAQPSNFGQVFTFAPTSASHVRLVVQSNHGSTFVTGMSEAAFREAVPAPGAMALLGMGGLIIARRRRA